MGPHDSGKTTLLQEIAGLLQVEKGEIALVGERMSTPMISALSHQRPVWLAFQDYALFTHYDRVGESGFGCTVTMTQEHKNAVQEMLTLLGLTGLRGVLSSIFLPSSN
ncbi:MAG: ATP-binding cassette domain-containing protein [Symbiopectobacterium sp.]